MPTLEGADSGFTDSVNRLMNDTGATLTSGYRSNAEQTTLYNQALAKYGSEQEARKWAAKPGGSNHEHGFAADIGNYQNISDAQLAKYGLYRPMEHEPWHVEPIGHRAKAGSAAYTTNPNIPKTETTQVMEQLGSVIDSLFANVGEQGSVVGEENSLVADQIDSPATMASPQPETTAIQEDDYSQGVLSSGRQSSGNTPANESAYADLFNSVGAKYGINPKILQEVARQESGFNPKAGSSAGAQGLMQFMPGTAKGLGIDPMDPNQAVDGAGRLLSGYLEQYNGDLSKALAAYNAGPGAVQKYGGVPPYKETQNYVNKITAKVNG